MEAGRAFQILAVRIRNEADPRALRNVAVFIGDGFPFNISKEDTNAMSDVRCWYIIAIPCTIKRRTRMSERCFIWSD
ncbi:jg6628 [Pararge aegeria aegeria]|uniref:Jg6628 protein n=1 Tax=Pararge aegeria aegeria TaxID=348720 RepID=A0A8S4RQ22_9NEOP|nr:jg6628 [Pararge aegeria aegeria]